MIRAILIIVRVFVVAIMNAQRPALVFQRSVVQMSLVELYTPEVCSRCPLAEMWLSRVKSSPGLWKGFVPVTFHVDY